ncbi:MAG: hypothetical protein ACYC75_03260 [Minisyncoccota bacterium]
MQHHAFVVEAEAEGGIEAVQAWAERELGVKTAGNPDVVVLRYGLFSVEDARRVSELAAGAPFAGSHKVVIIAAGRAYHEAQNALLKIFEEPPIRTYLFLVLPTLGGLLPTLRSRVTTLETRAVERRAEIPDITRVFIKASKEKRSALIKKLASGADEEERREHRDEAIALVNGVEVALLRQGLEGNAATLSDIATLRDYFYDRSAPVRMILEHLSLVIPKNLL